MLCDSKSDDPTPLVPAPGSEEVDRLQGKRPWAKYWKASDRVTGDKVKHWTSTQVRERVLQESGGKTREPGRLLSCCAGLG